MELVHIFTVLHVTNYYQIFSQQELFSRHAFTINKGEFPLILSDTINNQHTQLRLIEAFSMCHLRRTSRYLDRLDTKWFCRKISNYTPQKLHCIYNYICVLSRVLSLPFCKQQMYNVAVSPRRHHG